MEDQVKTVPKVDKIIAVLEAEEQGLCASSLGGCSRVGFIGCFAGALLFATPEFRDDGAFNEVDVTLSGSRGRTVEARRLLKRTYGLLRCHIVEGMTWNDQYLAGPSPDGRRLRRNHVVQKIRENWT